MVGEKGATEGETEEGQWKEDMKKKPRQAAGMRHVKRARQMNVHGKPDIGRPTPPSDRDSGPKRGNPGSFFGRVRKITSVSGDGRRMVIRRQKHASITRDRHGGLLPLSDENPLFPKLISRTRFVVPLRARLYS